MEKTNKIRVGATPDEPYVYDCFKRYPHGCPLPGTDIEYLHTILSGMLNKSVEYVEYQNYSLLDAALKNADIDVLGVSYAYDANYIENYYYTAPAFRYGIGLTVKTHYSLDSKLLLFSSFKITTWSAIAVMSLLISAFGVMVYFKRRSLKIGSKLANFLYVTWFIFLSLLLNLHGNLVACDLLLPGSTPQPPFQTMDELGRKLLSKQCRFGILSDYETSEEFASVLFKPTHNKSWASNLDHAYKLNPPLIADAREDLLEKIFRQDCFVIVDYVLPSGASYFDNFCELKTLTFDGFSMRDFAFYHNRDDLEKVVNEVITSSPFYAFSEKLRLRYFIKTRRNCKAPEVSAVIDVVKILDSIAVLFIGISCSGLLFFIILCKSFIKC